MMRVIVDTGPLVAYFNGRDRWHSWAAAQMAAIRPPLLTCEPVLTEASFLIQRAGGQPSHLVRKVAERGIEISMELGQDAAAVQALMERYADAPMSLADACLVRLSEKFPDHKLFTLDADFEHYRRHGRQVIPLLRPA